MAKYFVSVPMWATAYATIEADTPEDAIEQMSTPQVCAQCGGWGKSESDPHIELSDDMDWDKAEAEQVDQ